MKVKEKVLRDKLKDVSNKIQESIEKILEYETSLCEEYKAAVFLLVKESLKLRYMLGESTKDLLETPEYDESKVIEIARLNESITDKLLEGDDFTEKVVKLETYLFGKDNKLLESYLKSSDDLGIEFQRAIVKGLIEKTVAVVEACKNKKKTKKKTKK